MKKCPERFLDLTNRFRFLELPRYVIFSKIEHNILKISHIYIDIQNCDGLPPLKKESVIYIYIIYITLSFFKGRILEPASAFWMLQKSNVSLKLKGKKCLERILDLTNRFSALELPWGAVFIKFGCSISDIFHIYIDIQNAESVLPSKKESVI